MSQSGLPTPTVVMNVAGNKQPVPLRDYLNVRVAPFLKKAITQSLEAEPEFPLQWLGEYLIHQSILYEGNPDSTAIREKFRYKFETPAPVEPTSNGEPEIPELEPEQEPEPIESHEAMEVPQQNGDMEIKEEQKDEPILEPASEPVPAPVAIATQEVQEVQDTEMADTS